MYRELALFLLFILIVLLVIHRLRVISKRISREIIERLGERQERLRSLGVRKETAEEEEPLDRELIKET